MIKIKIEEKKYKNKIVFRNVDMEIKNSKKLITITGDSGSGKTTLINILKGIDKSYKGEIIYKENKITKMNNDISVVYQDNKLYDNISVYENLYLFSKDIKKIMNYLKEFDLLNEKDNLVKNISGGQKQRVAIIRSLLLKTKTIMLDEPTSALDDINFHNFVEIITKLNKKVQIIIITHDKRFEEIQTVRYHIENKNIVCLNEEINEETTFDKDKKEEKFSLISTFWILLKNIKLMYIYKILILTVLTILFLIISVGLYGQLNEQLSSYTNGISNDIIIMNSQTLKENYTEVYNGENYTFTHSPDRLYWSDEDIKKIEEIDGVESIYLSSFGVSTNSDYQHNTFNKQIKKESLEELKKYPSYNYAQDIINLSFDGVGTQKEIYDKYRIGNTLNLEIIQGEYPDDYSNEILIPDFLAMDVENSKEVVGKKVTLPVVNISTNKKSDKEYIISGVYETNYKTQILEQYTIYTGYAMETPEDGKKNITEDFYLEDLEAYKEDPVYLDFYKESYSSYENYKDYEGDSLSDLVIILDSPDKLEEVTNELNEIFPNNKQLSKMSLKNENADMLKGYRKAELTVLTILTIIFSFISIIALKMYFKFKTRDYSILIINNYKKINIYKVLLFEIIVDVIITIMGTFVVIGLLNFVKYPLIQLFLQQVNSLFSIIILLIFYLIIFIFIFCTSIWKLRKKKIKEQIK